MGWKYDPPGTDKVAQRTSVTKTLPNLRVNFLVRFAPKAFVLLGNALELFRKLFLWCCSCDFLAVWVLFGPWILVKQGQRTLERTGRQGRKKKKRTRESGLSYDWVAISRLSSILLSSHRAIGRRENTSSDSLALTCFKLVGSLGGPL